MSATRTDQAVTWYDIAAETGISVRSLRTIKYRSDHNRRLAADTGDASHVKPGDLPEPAGYLRAKGRPGRPRPYWNRSDIDAWIARKG